LPKFLKNPNFVFPLIDYNKGKKKLKIIIWWQKQKIPK
jgi:hypothetical protein